MAIAPTREVRTHGTVTVKEFAQAMHVSAQTVRIWIKAGHIRGIKMGNEIQHHWRIPRSELDRLDV